jgi:hypothetical protein
MPGSEADAEERSHGSGNVGTLATRASTQAAAPALVASHERRRAVKRRRAVESRGSACLRVSVRLPYPYGPGLMGLRFWGSGEVSGKVRCAMGRLDLRGVWAAFELEVNC